MKRALAGPLVGAVVFACVAAARAEGPAPARPASPIAPPRAGTAGLRPASLIVLDAGHGGKDLGAVRRGTGREKDLALAITRKVRDRLETLGVQTRLTRDSDVYVPLDRRIKDSIDWGGAIFVSLHLNQDHNKKAEGIEVYTFGRERSRRFRRRLRHRLPPLPAPPREAREASAELAEDLVQSLRSGGFAVEPVNKAAFYVLKNPKLPSVLVELGYLSNSAEAARLADPIYQDKLADTIAASLREHVTGSDGSALAELPKP